jgi:hypothetical protein
MKRNSNLWLILTCSLSALTAFGQPVFVTYDSLELRVAQAHSIVRGTVSNCTGAFIERPGGYYGGTRPDGSRRPDGVMCYTITVKVDEVLKGKRSRTIELVQETITDDKRFEQWAEHHTSFLWFGFEPNSPTRSWSNLRGVDAQTNVWTTIRLSDPVPGETMFSRDPPIYSMDFIHLTNSNEILARVRKEAKHNAEPPRIHTFKSIWSADPPSPFASLAVPVNATLEELARRMVRSPDQFLRTNDWTPTNAEQRVAYQNGIEAQRSAVQAAGITALQYFKSNENIKLLKPFLNHPALPGSQDPPVAAEGSRPH